MLHHMDSISKLRDNKTKAMVNTKFHKTTEYFLSGPTYESDKNKRTESTQQIHQDFDDVFNGVWCFEGIFSFQVKDGSQLYQAPPKKVSVCTAGGLKEMMERLQKQQIIVPLGIDETSEWYNSFILVHKVN